MPELGDQTEWQEKKLEYLRYEYDLKPEDKVLDIGSYRNEFADGIKRKFGCQVECFEALDNRAAWIRDGFIILGGHFYYTSFFDKSNPTSYGCVDIKPFVKDIALCKINIEGMEYDLLEYMMPFISEVKNLQVQFHLIEGYDKRYKRISEELSKTHKLTWRYPFVWENWERC